MAARASTALPSSRARLTGIVYLVYFVSAFALALRIKLIVASDAAATASRILGSEATYRFTVVSDLTSYFIYMILTYMLYQILRGANRDWARVAVAFSLMGCAVQVTATAGLMAPLLLLKDSAFAALPVAQRQELALLAIKMYSHGYNVGLLFFGGFDLLMGLLLARSRFVPRWIGWLLIVAGVGWMGVTFTNILAPQWGRSLGTVVLPLGALAELALALWLAVRGISETAWAAAHEA